MPQYSVAFEASTRRPSIDSSPHSSSSRASATGSSSGGVSSSGFKARAAVVAVLAGTDVSGRVERLPAQRARRAAGGDDAPGPLDERAGAGRFDAHAQRVGAVLGVLEQRLLGHRG